MAKKASFKMFEKSPADIRDDRKGAKKAGKPMAAFERSGADKREDAKGKRGKR